MMNSESTTGLVMVFTGPGKGKTTAAFGAALRAAGAGLAVQIVQFIKPQPTSEGVAMASVPGVEVRAVGRGMIRGSTPRREDMEAAQAGFADCEREAMTGRWGMIVLDEVGPALKYGLVETDRLLGLIHNRPPHVHLVLTGRGMPEEINQAADTVTIMNEERHHFAAGIAAQKGIEY